MFCISSENQLSVHVGPRPSLYFFFHEQGGKPLDARREFAKDKKVHLKSNHQTHV